MDCKTLIREIAQNPPLWDKKHKNFSKRSVVDKIWETVAANLNSSKDDCKKKFKYLKDEYRKAQRKIPQSASAAEKHVSNFKYFKMMGFLRGESNIEFMFDDNTLCDDTFSETDANKPTTSQILTKSQCSKRTVDIDDKSLEIERKRIRSLETDIDRSEQEDSDDLLFFKSLLPYVKNISPLKKLEFRANLIHTIINITREGEFDYNN